MAEVGIEDSQHAPFELLATGHRQRHGRRRVALDAGDNVEEVLSVVGRSRTASQRQIVTRALALRAKLLRGGPDERVEPVHRTSEASERVTDEVVTTHVGELVQQYSATTVESPRITLCGQNDGRSEDTAGKRHLGIFTAQQPRRLLE